MLYYLHRDLPSMTSVVDQIKIRFIFLLAADQRCDALEGTNVEPRHFESHLDLVFRVEIINVFLLVNP